jgi:hypothetical protein
MSRETTTLIVLVIVALAVNVIGVLQMGTPRDWELNKIWPWMAITSAVFLVMAFFFGAANAAIAALWAWLWKRQANLAGAFNLGVGVFVALQALGVVAYEYYGTNLRPDAVTQSTPHEPTPAKETK